jgi:hypothetical protein
MERAGEAADETSVAKGPARKPHLVSFGGKGALNQGIASTAKIYKIAHQ